VVPAGEFSGDRSSVDKPMSHDEPVPTDASADGVSAGKVALLGAPAEQVATVSDEGAPTDSDSVDEVSVDRTSAGAISLQDTSGDPVSVDETSTG
jgi:hypothetical protein